MSDNNNLLVIDTDPGVDDAFAILVALNRQTRHLANVLAITTVRGNVGVDQVSLNALRVLQVADRLDVPVYRGVDQALIGGSSSQHAAHYHGTDGLGDVPDPDSPDLSRIQDEHAVMALIRLTNKYPGQITLVCLGPLTNIAVALHLDPQLGNKLRRCIIMGGNTTGKGNFTVSAEFNFYSDPEAAQVVLNQLKCDMTIIPWELCVEYSLPWDVLEKILAQPSRRSQFIRRILSQSIEKYYDGRGSDEEDRQQFVLCDELAVSVAVDEKVALESMEAPCSVETAGSLTRGQMVVDRRPIKSKSPNVRLVTKLDFDRCVQLLTTAVAD